MLPPLLLLQFVFQKRVEMLRCVYKYYIVQLIYSLQQSYSLQSKPAPQIKIPSRIQYQQQSYQKLRKLKMPSPLLLLLIPLLLILYTFYMFFIKIYLDARKFRKMDPTLKTFISPFSGIQGVQKYYIQKFGDSHKFAKQLVKENPEINGYLTNLGYKPMIVICSAKLIKQISTNSRSFKKFNLYKHSNKSYTKGIFLVQGQDWSAQKAIIRHSFNHDSLKKMIPIMNQSIYSFLTKVKQQVKALDGKPRPFGVVHENQLMIGQILVRIFFSEEAMGKYVHGRKLPLALADFTTDMFKRSRTGQNIIMELFFKQNVIKINFSGEDRKLEKLIDDIRVILFEIVQSRLKNPTNDDDFINLYINQMRQIDEKIAAQPQSPLSAQSQSSKLRPITKQQIVHQLISFYFAGIDTTGHLIAMALYALAQYPEVKQKIIIQLKEVLGGEEISYENLQKLDYMGKFLDECLRMWPPAVGVLLRVAKQDMNLGPYQIPAGTLVGTNIIGLMHNPKYYKQPQVFSPQRWNDRTLYNQQPYSFIPFSAGQRSCIGKYLALMQAKLMIIGFLTNFQIQRNKEVSLRMHAKFLYEPIQENLVLLKEGGIDLTKKE